MVHLGCCRHFLGPAFQLDRDELRHSRLLHRHAVQHIGGFHCPFAVGDDDELRFFAELAK